MANVDPPQPVPPLGPQPDFAFISQALHQVATQFGHIPNLPPFPQGNALMQQMLQMQQQQQQFQQQQQQFQEQVQRQMQQFQQAQQQMQQDITAVRNDIQALRNEVRTSRQAT
jgi:cytochrome c556